MKRILASIFIIIIIVLVGYNYITSDFKKTPPTIYINANIITLENQQPNAQAMFVKNGKIKAIGNQNDILKLKRINTQIVDLNGNTVLPGFIDSHTHVALSAFLESMVDLSGFTHHTNNQVWSYLAQQVKTKKANEWIVCKGIDPVLVPDLVLPKLSFLDSIAPNNPLVLISQSLHSYWANSMAFKLAGVNKHTKNPSLTSFYEKDSLGNLTGFIAEQQAFKPFLKQLQKHILTSKSLIASTSKVLETYAKNGNTTVVSTGITINDAKPLRLYKFLATDKPSFINELLSKVGMLPKRKPYPRHFIYIRNDKSFLLPKTKPKNNDFYNIVGVKLWYDGSPYTGSMYLNKDYLNNDYCQNRLRIPKNSSGKTLFTQDAFFKLIKKYHHQGWQIAVHAQGDAATDEVLNAFSKLNAVSDITKDRDRIEHCLLLSADKMQIFKRLNMIPNFHINHLYYYGLALKNKIIGTERAEKMLAVASAQKLNLKYALHADQPMFKSKPFRLIQTAVERQTKEGDTLGFNQRITVLQGLKAMTINAAWQIHKENQLGTLKKGKYADFIVVDKNPLTIPTHNLENIIILKTFINGNPILR